MKQDLRGDVHHKHTVDLPMQDIEAVLDKFKETAITIIGVAAVANVACHIFKKGLSD